MEKAYGRLLKPKPEPKPEPEATKRLKRELHRVTAFVGYCSHCNAVRAKGNVIDLMKRGRELKDTLIKSAGAKFVCRDCGWPFGADEEEVKAIDACFLCGGKKAVRLKSE